MKVLTRPSRCGLCNSRLSFASGVVGVGEGWIERLLTVYKSLQKLLT